MRPGRRPPTVTRRPTSRADGLTPGRGTGRGTGLHWRAAA